MGRKRRYASKTEKQRAYRTRKRMKRNLALGKGTIVDYGTRTKIESINPELKAINTLSIEEVQNMDEETFQDYLRNLSDMKFRITWVCEHCEQESFLYREDCHFCGLPRPDDLEEDARELMNMYPFSSKFSNTLCLLEQWYGPSKRPS